MLQAVQPSTNGHVIDLTGVPTQKLPEHDFSYDVGIVGLGYVGLPTALAFTAAGNTVLGVDASEARLGAITQGHVDVLPSDRQRLHAALGQRSLTLAGTPEELGAARSVIICVPTPVDHYLVPDLQPLAGACATVVAHARTGQLIILTSTTYVGTTRDLLVKPLERRGFRVGVDIFVAFSPERIDPGNVEVPQEAVPRIVGGVTPACGRRAALALSTYAHRVHPVSSPETAELAKLYENAFRAVNIALVNELADMSRELDVQVMEVIEAAGTKPYGFMTFFPGPGVGGHCIPCDPHYLLWQLKSKRHEAPLLEQAMVSIAQRPRQVVERTREVLAEKGLRLRGSTVVVVGVTYKPGVADVRESPALEVLDRLAAAGADVRYIDPLVPEVRLGDGRVLRADTDPAEGPPPDLVVVHTIHPGFDDSWVRAQPLILDATYRFHAAPHRVTL